VETTGGVFDPPRAVWAEPRQGGDTNAAVVRRVATSSSLRISSTL
jgi:hypothetical protein